MLLNDFLKEHRKVEEQQATITELEKELQANAVRQQRQIEALTVGLQKVSGQLELAKQTGKMAKMINKGGLNGWVGLRSIAATNSHHF